MAARTGPALAHPEGTQRQLTFAEARVATDEIARGLMALGLAPGDRVAIQSRLRPEWTLTLLAAASCGLVLVSLLPTTVPEEIVHVVNDCDAKAIICEDGEQLAKVRTALPELPGLRHVIVIDEEPAAEDAPRTLAELRTAGSHAVPAAALARRRAAVTPTTCWSSSTPREPPARRRAARSPTATTWRCCGPIPRLRSAHRTSRTPRTAPSSSSPAPTPSPCSCNCSAGGPDTPSPASTAARPTGCRMELRAASPAIVPLVPLALEMIYRSVLAPRSAAERAELIDAARTGLRVRRMRAAGETVPDGLQKWFDHAENTLFAEVRERFGGNLRRATVSGAPVSPDILSFFVGCGLPLVECYGMTETAAAATSNTPGDNRLGTVGTPLPGVEIAISGDGEVLIKGDHVFHGYWGYDEGEFGAVRDGWLHTGDLGALDRDGFLRLTGRKKELIQLSNGMAVTPTRWSGNCAPTPSSPRPCSTARPNRTWSRCSRSTRSGPRSGPPNAVCPPTRAPWPPNRSCWRRWAGRWRRPTAPSRSTSAPRRSTCSTATSAWRPES